MEMYMFLQNKIFLPADFNFSCGATKKSNNQGIAGVFLPARLFFSPSSSILLPPLRSKLFPAIEGNTVFSLSFQDFFSYLPPPPTPLESPEIKGFRRMSLFSFRGGEEEEKLKSAYGKDKFCDHRNGL